MRNSSTMRSSRSRRRERGSVEARPGRRQRRSLRNAREGAVLGAVTAVTAHLSLPRLDFRFEGRHDEFSRLTAQQLSNGMSHVSAHSSGCTEMSRVSTIKGEGPRWVCNINENSTTIRPIEQPAVMTSTRGSHSFLQWPWRCDVVVHVTKSFMRSLTLRSTVRGAPPKACFAKRQSSHGKEYL